MYCSKCGAKLSGNGRFCPKCGQKIEIQNQQLAVNVKKSGKGVKIFIIAVVCAVVAAAFALTDNKLKNSVFGGDEKIVDKVMSDKNYVKSEGKENDTEKEAVSKQDLDNEKEEKAKTIKQLDKWKVAYIDFFDEHNALSEISAGCYLKDITGDGVPEIFCRGSDGDVCYYLNKSYEVKKLSENSYDVPMFYAKNVFGYSGTYSRQYYTVYNYNKSTGEFEMVYNGDRFDDDGDLETDEFKEACLNEKIKFVYLDKQKGYDTITDEIRKY